MIKICKVCGKSEGILSFEDTCYSCSKALELNRIQSKIQSGEEDVDTFSSDYVICPHCGYAHDTNLGYADFPEIYEDGDHDMTCVNCGKSFVLETMISYSWETKKVEK
jgi:hypothetical protein